MSNAIYTLAALSNSSNLAATSGSFLISLCIFEGNIASTLEVPLDAPFYDLVSIMEFLIDDIAVRSPSVPLIYPMLPRVFLSLD